MANQQQKATMRLRELILAGDFRPGEWLREQVVSELLGTSRTPARIAMQILEQEGLLQFFPNRGFCVAEFTMQQVSDAVDVRGTLEGMACALLAQQDLPANVLDDLQKNIERGRAIVDARDFGTHHTVEWSAVNGEFHRRIVEASRNKALAASLAINDRIPLAAASAVTLFSHQIELGLPMFRTAQTDHEEILDAILDRDSARAEHLMREHARRSRNNKVIFIQEMKSRQLLESVPGGNLLVG